MAALNAQAEPKLCDAPNKPDPDCGHHNMMLIGQESVFLSHLPMFQSETSPEHRFQVILRGTFRKNEENVDGIYLQDRQSHPDIKMYTVVPDEPFILSALFNSDNQGPMRTSFPATVFRGHFERRETAPEEILSGVDVNLTWLVYARELRLDARKSNALEYILFGTAKDLFLAHRITQAPDFDQILSAKIDAHPFTDAELSNGVLVTIPGHANSPAQRLKAHEAVAGMARVTDLNRLLPLQIHVGTEFYFEEGELSSPLVEPFKPFEQTPLETEAGF
jgi:hypothetical protein